ncbi:hypothetical protein H6A03_05295 [[Clostridium] spiroforme]|nr:hypothetical protein [Thomasclavelia spiroformis]MBM6880187.1 hypothetical protein [Thomasclavelia spiroformis]
MKKKHQSNLLITILFTVVVSLSLYFLYDIYSFQTYGTITYYDYLLSIDSKECQLSDFKLFKDQSNYYCGDGMISFTAVEGIQDGEQCTLSFILKSDGKQYRIDYPVVYEVNHTYTLENNETAKSLKKVDEVRFEMKADDTVVLTKKVKMHAIQAIYCFNKEFRIENACISEDFMRLGYLTTTNKEIIKEYPMVSVEYRYVKDESQDEEDDDNYIVFKKISMPSKDYVNVSNYETYEHDSQSRGSLLDKKLSVVVIFSNDQKENYTFKMNFTREAGEQHE